MHAFTTRILLCLVFIKLISARTILNDYKKLRSNVLEEELLNSLGGRLQLSPEEQKVNKILMELKTKELDNGFQNPEHFNLSRHYMTYRDQIEKSKVYQIIRRMPKGGALHIHSTLMLDADYMLNLTYESHLYICYTPADDNMRLLFSDTIPDRPCLAKWLLLKDLREASDDVETFDKDLKSYFTLYSKDETDFYSDNINKVWKKFHKVYLPMKDLLTYRPIREKFIYDALKKLYEENIMYIEIRSGLHTLYELNGTVYDGLYGARLHQDIVNKFIEEYPDFIGMKMILTRNRVGASVERVQDALNWARKLKSEVPDFFAGFDLVGQEDLGNPLTDYLPILIEAKEEMNFYFHCGETNWFGTPSDENLIDAILLGTKRIGHGYALIKHPTLLAAVKERDIAVEVNVISNSVLSLVRDVRNHPLATYLAFDLPVIIASDDPGVWGSDFLSQDFYVAFVAVASKHADLRMLKQLALNSIKYSALDDRRKEKFRNVFNKRWCQFLQDIINTFR